MGSGDEYPILWLYAGDLEIIQVLLGRCRVIGCPPVDGCNNGPTTDKCIVVVVAVTDACAEAIDQADHNLGERREWNPSNRIGNVVANRVVCPLLGLPQGLPVPVPDGVRGVVVVDDPWCSPSRVERVVEARGGTDLQPEPEC